MLVFDEDIVLSSASGEVLCSTLGSDDGTELGCFYGSFDGSNDGKTEGILISDSVG